MPGDRERDRCVPIELDAEFRHVASQALDLPESAVGGDWESVLESCKGMVADYLERECAGSAVLKMSMAVAVGFVDGEAELVWKR